MLSNTSYHCSFKNWVSSIQHAWKMLKIYTKAKMFRQMMNAWGTVLHFTGKSYNGHSGTLHKKSIIIIHNCKVLRFFHASHCFRA